jgi:cytosine/adenosine deaminase-related metal-dependent hydrolase
VGRPIAVGLLTMLSVSEGLYKEMTALSREKNIHITMHCAEAPADRTFFASHDHTPMSYCESVNLLGPQTVLVHMVHLDDSDIAKLAETGTHVVHCPSSNTKLASGICKVPQLLGEGVNVTLGTDGAPCNNTCDMLQEQRLAGMLHKVSTMNPTSVPAETVMEMATINGAKALGLASSIGSLEVGKKADFAVIDMRAAHLQPWHNPVSAVVYAGTGRDVDLVVVNGKEVVRGGQLLTMDEEVVWKEAARRSKEVVTRAGLTKEVSARWPIM